MRATRVQVLGTILFVLLLAIAVSAATHPLSAYTPRQGDSFGFSETITVNNGQGSYTGYTDQTLVTGMEQINSVTPGLVSSSYNFSYQYTSSQGNSSSYPSSGQYTWSSGNFTYVTGTDNQVGYSKPTYVWFAMNPSLPVGASFSALNTSMTILSKNYSLQLPTEGKFVQAIQAQGTGAYPRDDSYGVFTATYTWTEYFDPTTGYIIGYNYVEQDSGQYQGLAGSFTYTDDLYVTSTSYALASASPSSTTTSSSPLGSAPYVTYALLLVAVLVIVAVVVYAATRRRGKGEPLPKHPQYVSPTPPLPPSSYPPPSQSKIDLGSRPGEQVVIREVAKVNCKYCFPPDQELITSKGIKKIEAVGVGELVLSHSGKYHKVSHVFQHEYEGVLIGIRTWGSYAETWCTPEHPFLVSKLLGGHDSKGVLAQVQWLEAGVLQKNDFLCLPRNQEAVIPASIPSYFQYRGQIKNESLLLTNDLLVVAGWYLAEGWFSPKTRDVVFTLGKSPLEYQRAFELKSAIERLGVSTRLVVSRNGVRLSAYSMTLGRILATHFGSGATRKRLPQWVLDLPNEMADLLLQSYLEGDGYKVRDNEFRASTVSRQLAHDLQLLGIKCGYLTALRIKRKSGISIILGRQVHLNECYDVDFVLSSNQRKKRGSLDSQFAYHQISVSERVHYKGPVFNLQVENDNSYCTLAHVTHNCGTLIPTTAETCPYCGAPRQ